MKFRIIQLLILIYIFMSGICDLQGMENKEFIFSSPIWLRPILEERSAELLRTDAAVIQVPPFYVECIIDNITEELNNQGNDTKIFRLQYGNKEKVFFRIYVKNGYISKIEQFNAAHKKEISYVRDLQAIVGRICDADEKFLKQNKALLVAFFRKEDLILALPEGKTSLIVDLTLAGSVKAGTIKFSTAPSYEYAFCYSNKEVRNEAYLVTGKILFSATFSNGTITYANVYEDSLNGFDCSFYHDLSVKYYLPTVNGKQKLASFWKENGKEEQKISPEQFWKDLGFIKSHKE